MTRYDRAEIAEFVQKWVDANIECERNKDWKPLAEFYADDATYGWNYGTKDDFMAVGIDEIREIALGQEMAASTGGSIPHPTIIDPETGDVLCGSRSPGTRSTRDRQAVRGPRPGGSWFLLQRQAAVGLAP